jgi:putative transposase
VEAKSRLCGRQGRLYTSPVIKGRPPRLDQIFQSYNAPVFFVTSCTLHRVKIEQLEVAHAAFTKYALRGRDDFNIAVGRYVIMPDHIHLFVQGDLQFRLETWVGGLKRAISVSLGRTTSLLLWQPGFFDHLLRSDESYAGKWEYVRQNPVRHGLVSRAEDWPYQGEIVLIDRV